MQSRTIKAVIFDLDGTLIDTEKYYRIFWPKTMAEFGYEMTDEQALAIRSLGRPFAPEWFKKTFDDPNLDYWAIRNRRKAVMEAFFADHPIELKPYAVEILDWLRAHGYITALATANDEERANRYLTDLGLRDYFDAVCCATMVEYGKPYPDIYTFACEKLGLPPEACMAVEDSANGIKSAHAAGLAPVYVPDQTEPEAELLPLLYARVDNLWGLTALL